MQPFYQYEPTDDRLSQPTLVSGGFEPGQLYEGIMYDEDARLASYECNTCNSEVVNRRMPILDGIKGHIARLARFGKYDYRTFDSSCVECEQSFAHDQPLFDNRQHMYQHGSFDCGGCGSCQRCALGSGLKGMIATGRPANSYVTEAGCCCEPMFYFAVFGGYSQLENSDTLNNSPLALPLIATSGSLAYDDGFGIGVTLGQWQGRNLRTEIEYSYRRNNVASLQRFGAPVVGIDNQMADGSANLHAGMYNAFWDFNRCYFGFRPYVGAGIGFAFLDLSVSATDSGTPLNFTNDCSAFAYQFIAGGSRPCSMTTEWFVEYRYFNTDSFQLNVAEFFGGSNYQSDNVFVGFRKRF